MINPAVIAVTAARNELSYLPRTAPSILKQTHPPIVYVIADDGSTDGTEKYLKTINCLTIHVSSPRINLRGVNQCIALLRGIQIAEKYCPEWKYLLKTDGDTYIPPNYIEKLIKIMERNPEIGIIGGVPENEKIRLSRVSDAAKIYRRECWNQIEGLDIVSAFDSHALLKAHQKGWTVRSIPQIKFTEYREHNKQKLKWWILEGRIRKNFGFPLWHNILAVSKNIRGKPYIIGPLAAILSSILSPRIQDPKLDPDFVKEFSAREVKHFGLTVWRNLFG